MPVDLNTALKWYHLGAEQGHPSAQYSLGFIYREGRLVAQDYTEAAKWFERAARRGDGMAQSDLALMYLDGQGVERNPLIARMWYEVALLNGGLKFYGDPFAGLLSTEEIQQAKEMAKACKASAYQNCTN